jgi:hypothetical protein
VDFKFIGRPDVGSKWTWERVGNRKLPAGKGSTTVFATWAHSRDGTAVIDSDPWLEAHRSHLLQRNIQLEEQLARVDSLGGLDVFSRGFDFFGFTREVVGGRPGIRFREWAPGARDMSLIGDFNSWNENATRLTRDDFGVWSTFLPDVSSDKEAITHNSYIRLSVVICDGSRVNRLPAYIRYAVYDEKLNEYVGKYWHPPPSERHAWRHERISSKVVDDYRNIPGNARIKSRSSWIGTVGPTEAETYGLLAPGRNAADTQTTGVSTSQLPSPAGLARDSSIVAEVSRALTSAASASKEQQKAQSLVDPAASGIRIYESHVGMAGEEGKVSSYREFATNVLPRIKKLGYNCGKNIQMSAASDICRALPLPPHPPLTYAPSPPSDQFNLWP